VHLASCWSICSICGSGHSARSTWGSSCIATRERTSTMASSTSWPGSLTAVTASSRVEPYGAAPFVASGFWLGQRRQSARRPPTTTPLRAVLARRLSTDSHVARLGAASPPFGSGTRGRHCSFQPNNIRSTCPVVPTVPVAEGQTVISGCTQAPLTRHRKRMATGHPWANARTSPAWR
jgi:hypothetical protein